MMQNVQADGMEKKRIMSNLRCCKKVQQSRGIPDSSWSICVLFAGFLSTAFCNGCLYSFGVLLPQLLDYFGESRAKTAVVGALGQGVGYFLSPLACYLFERFGYRNTVLGSALLAVVGMTASAASPVLPLLYLTYGILTSIGLSFIHNASTVVVMNHFVKWRSLASGVLQSAFGIGMLFMTQVSQILIERFGWRWTFGIWAAFATTMILLGLLFDGKESRTFHMQIEPSNTSVNSKLLLTLKNRLLMLYSCSFSLCYMAFYVPHIFLVEYSEQHLNIPHNRSTILYAGFAGVTAISRIFYCKLGTYKYFNRFTMYQVSMTLCGLTHLFIPLCKSYTHVAFVMLSLGFLDGGFWGLAPMLVTDSAGIQNLNYAWGVFSCAVSVAGVSGSPLAGLIADLSNSYLPAFYASGATLIFASCLMFLRKWTNSPNEFDERLERQQLVVHYKDDFVVVTERETVL